MMNENKYISMKDIIQEWFEKNDYDGITHPEYDCSCFKEDLFSCYDPNGRLDPGVRCLAGFKEKCKNGSYTIIPGKKEGSILTIYCKDCNKLFYAVSIEYMNENDRNKYKNICMMKGI